MLRRAAAVAVLQYRRSLPAVQRRLLRPTPPVLDYDRRGDGRRREWDDEDSGPRRDGGRGGRSDRDWNERRGDRDDGSRGRDDRDPPSRYGQDRRDDWDAPRRRDDRQDSRRGYSDGGDRGYGDRAPPRREQRRDTFDGDRGYGDRPPPRRHTSDDRGGRGFGDRRDSRSAGRDLFDDEPPPARGGDRGFGDRAPRRDDGRRGGGGFDDGRGSGGGFDDGSRDRRSDPHEGPPSARRGGDRGGDRGPPRSEQRHGGDPFDDRRSGGSDRRSADSGGPPSSRQQQAEEQSPPKERKALTTAERHRGIEKWLGFGGRWSPSEREGKFVKGPSEWEGAEGQHLCEVSWEDRPMPNTHHRKPEEPQWEGPRSKRDRGAGGWQGRKEDEERKLSGWKAVGGPWTWRVTDAECDLSYSGFDITRERQSKPWAAAMAGALLVAGQHEWEIRCTGHTRAMRIGVCRSDLDVFENTAWGDQAKKSWVLTDLGSSWHGERMVARGSPYRQSGDVVTCHCDMDAGTLHFSVNGERQPGEFTGLKGPLRPLVNFREVPATAEMRHLYSSQPPDDAGPFYLGQMVHKGQNKDIAIPEH